MTKPKTDFTNIKCCKCEKGDLHSRNAFREIDIRGFQTKNWLCSKCYNNIRTYGTAGTNGIFSKKEKFLKTRQEKKHGKSCSICRLDFSLIKGFPQIGETGKWICHNCASKEYRRRPDSTYSLIKLMRNCRTGNQDPNSSEAIGDLFQLLTVIWRSTISIVHIEDLNKKLDNYRTPIDHSWDSELGIMQTRGRFVSMLTYNLEGWSLTQFKREWHKKIDNMICYCTNEDGTIIERIYIFPKEEILRVTGINIYNNDNYHKYDRYRFTDKEEIKKVNKIWKDIINGKIEKYEQEI